MKKYFFGIYKCAALMLFIMVFASCASKKSIHYLQDSTGEIDNVLKYENTMQPDDNLLITVTSPDADLVQKFNSMFLLGTSTEMRSSGNELLYTYLIDQKGEINFPTLGKIKLGGLTRGQSEDLIKGMLQKYVLNIGVNIRVTNFKVSVLGEVSRPGVMTTVGDRLTILEALSNAGDLTIYGKRKEVMVIRERDDVKSIAYVNLTDKNLINSPYYYLSHNDVIYVKPNQTRVNSSVIGPNLTVALSVVSLLITIITLSTR